MKFSYFLMNESTVYLGQRVGDVVTAIQDLKDNSAGMGKRQATSAATNIVNQIRTILHSHWDKKDIHSLESLQKVGVAIMRAIEDKDDLNDILDASIQELQGMTEKLGTPVNQLGTPEESPGEPKEPEGVQPPQGQNSPQNQQQQNQQQQAAQPQQPHQQMPQ